MQAPSPQFFAGMLDLGSEPDWERAARVVDLMRASGVRMVATPAVERPDGGTSLPFFAKATEPMSVPASIHKISDMVRRFDSAK